MIRTTRTWIANTIQEILDEYRCWIIDSDSNRVLKMKNPSTQVLKHAIKYDVSLLGQLSSLSDEVKKFAIDVHSNALEYISDQTDELVLRAVSINPYSIKYASQPSLKAMKKAVTRLPEVIQFLPNAPDQIQLIAINADPYLISYLVKPSLAIQLAAASKEPITILLIDHVKTGAIKRALETHRTLKSTHRDNFSLKGINLTTDQWWDLVREFPEFYNMMNLTDEQLSYAIICA